MHASPTSAVSPRRLRALLLSAVAAGAAAFALPAAADAATYTVWSCRGPDGAPVSARAWQLGGSPIATMTDTCASGGTLRVFVPAGRNGTYLDDAGARFQTLAGAQITGYTLWRVTQTGGSGVSGGFYTDVLENDFGFFSTSVDGCVATGCSGRGDASAPLGPGSSVFQRTGVALRSVSIAAGCSANISVPGSRCTDGGGVNAAFDLYRAAIEIDDSVPPAFDGAPTGPLLDGDAVGGRQLVEVPVSDVGAGAARVEARVDGALVATGEAGGDCRAPYTRPSPCPAQATLSVAIDTTALADGEHQLELTVVDGAGNTVAGPSSTVRIDNRPPPPPPPVTITTPAPPPVTVTTPTPPPVTVTTPAPPPAVRGDYVVTLSRRRVAAGASGAIAGRVTDREGAPQANAELLLQQRLYGPFGGEWAELRSFRADAAGRFRIAVPDDAQQLRVRFVPERAANTSFLSPAVDVVSRLSLRTRATPRALRNGGRMTISGRLRGAGPSARGKEVLVQAVVGDRWDTIDRVTADRRGAFRWRYRFVNTRTAARYSFRVVVAADSDRWPWRTTTSPRLRVRVRP